MSFYDALTATGPDNVRYLRHRRLVDRWILTKNLDKSAVHRLYKFGPLAVAVRHGQNRKGRTCLSLLSRMLGTHTVAVGVPRLRLGFPTDLRGSWEHPLRSRRYP